MTVIEVVDAQVTAYNAHDLDAFVACYAPDVIIRNGRGETLMSGIDALRTRYEQWFTTYPDVRAEIRDRVATGGWVVDQEHVSLGGDVIDGLVGYHVRDDRIDLVVMLLD